MSEPTRKDIAQLLDDVTAYIKAKVEADPRYHADMTEHEHLALCETILHEDAVATVGFETRVGIAIRDHRIGLVPGLLAQQERSRGA